MLRQQWGQKVDKAMGWWRTSGLTKKIVEVKDSEGGCRGLLPILIGEGAAVTCGVEGGSLTSKARSIRSLLGMMEANNGLGDFGWSGARSA